MADRVFHPKMNMVLVIKIVNRSNALNEITIENEEPEFYGGTFPSDIFVTKSNKLFIKDKEQNNLFKYKESKFEKESKVIDLKCGL
ncbi:hypothetical protein ABK040_015955 [Willaertia magna]